MLRAQDTISVSCRSQVKGDAGLRYLLLPLMAIAAAIALSAILPGAQPAWADGEKAVDVKYAMQVEGDGYRELGDMGNSIDNWEELQVEVAFGETFLEDKTGTLYVRADFFLRPADATDSSHDVYVYSGSVVNDYGVEHMYRYDSMDGVKGTGIIASFPIADVAPGTYRLVVDASAVRCYTNNKDKITEADWSAPRRFISKPSDTLTVTGSEGARPSLEKVTLPTAPIDMSYFAKLDAAPSDISHTLRWSVADEYDVSDPLSNWGLTLNQDGSITGTVIEFGYWIPALVQFNVAVYEMDGETVVGKTTRHFNIYVTEVPVIEDADASFQKGRGGIVANSKMSLQMRLSSAVTADGTATVSYVTTDGAEKSETYKLTHAANGSMVYVDNGAQFVPDDAAAITQVEFSVDSTFVDPYPLDLRGEGNVAPRLLAHIEGSLDETLTSPFLSVVDSDYHSEYGPLWLDVSETGAIEDLDTADVPAGTYDIALCASVDGNEVQVSDAIERVELKAGVTTDLTASPFQLGSYRLVEPTVTAPSGVDYTVNWYADPECTERLGTAKRRGWVNSKTVYVRAQPTGNDFFGFAPSEAVLVTEGNADSIELVIAPRSSCTVGGRVTKANAEEAFALQDLRVTLTLDAGAGRACTWSASPDADGNYSIAGVPVGTGATAKLVVSGALIQAAELEVDLSGAVAGGVVQAPDASVVGRQGVIVLATAVNRAEVFAADGTALSSTFSDDGRYIYLDDPSQVSAGDVLACKLYQGRSCTLYSGSATAYCETNTAPLGADKVAAVTSQEMERLGEIALNIENPYGKMFGAVLAKADTKAIVCAELGNEHTQIGSADETISYTFSSVPAGSYVVLLGDRDTLVQFDAGDKASLGFLEDALASRGENMYVKTDEIALEAGEPETIELSFPNSRPNAVPISTEDSSMMMTAQGTSIYYRMVVARGEADMPEGQDLNIIVNTSQAGVETDERNGNIVGSVVYINGKAARAINVVDGEGEGGEDEGDVYLLPNSVRNSFESSNGLYVVTIPAADIANGTYGDFPLAVSFSAPRLRAGGVSASASVAFGNYDWRSYHVDTSGFIKDMRHSTRYRVGASELSQAAITCFAPANVASTEFTVYGMAPTAQDVSGNVEVYLDGVKAASVAPDAASGLYSVKLALGEPFERSVHSVCAKVLLADGTTTVSSVASEVYYDPNTAALAKIETSTYNGSFTTSWENGKAASGHWYYLPEKPTTYRLTFTKGDGLAQEGDVHDVYVNVPRGTQVMRLKATYSAQGTWMTEACPMGNTPPTGEWVSYQVTVPKAEISQGDADKLAATAQARGANENGFIAEGKTAADYTLTTGEDGEGDVFFSVAADGSSATFEGVQITSTASDADAHAAAAWVAALPTDPLAGASAEEQGQLVEAGYLGSWKLASADGGLLEEDGDVGLPGADGSGVEYASAADGTNTVYERLDVIDSSWDKLPGAFDATGADAGKAACDIVSAYPYADGSGIVYKRITVTRDKFYQGICDTKTGRVYELVNDAHGEVTADTVGEAAGDEDAKTEWLFNQTQLIANGWSAYYDDLVGAIHGTKPKDVKLSGLVTGGMSAQSDASDLTLQSAVTAQMWPFSKNPPDYDKASASKTQQALMDWVMKNYSSGFADYANMNFNPTGTLRGGLESRIRAKWGSEAYKELMEKVAESAFSNSAGKAMELAGISPIVSQAVRTGASGAKGVYENITGDNAREFYVACQRFEAYQAALAYMQAHPEDSHFTLDGFPFGTSLPDPRKDQEEDKSKSNDDNAKKQEEGRKDDKADWPDGDDYDDSWKDKQKDLDDNSYRVPVPETNQPVIDPSGHVYAGVDENRVEGVSATLFEVADDGSRSLWGASEYGQVNPYATDEEGNYEWFVPEGKWSVTFTKPGFRPYTTGEEDGIGAAVTGWPTQTWYMPVAPAQLDVNINLVPTAAPEVESIEWTKAGIEIAFNQVMDVDSLEDAISLTRNGNEWPYQLSCSTVPRDDGFATKAVLVLDNVPNADDAYVLAVDGYARNYGYVNMQADYSTRVEVSAAAVDSGKLVQTIAKANRTLENAEAAKANVVESADGSDVATTATWAPPSAFATLEAAMEALGDVLADDSAASASISEATRKLQGATSDFRAACKSGTKSQGGDDPSQGGGGASGGGASGAKVGQSFVLGSGSQAAYYVVKTAASARADGSVWYVKPKAPKKLKSVTVPDTVMIQGFRYKVTGISAKAFSKCAKLKKVTVGNNVEIVSVGAFSGSKKLSKLTIGASVKTIGKGACKKCKKLKKVTVKSGLLTKVSCKNLVKGSKVKKVKLAGAAKKMKKTYKKYFPKKVKVS